MLLRGGGQAADVAQESRSINKTAGVRSIAAA